MGMKFLGTPIKQFDQLCNEEEVVMIEVKCYKKEDTIDPSTGVVVDDRVQTGGWGMQIHSWRDIFQFDSEDEDEDDFPDKKVFSDKIRESMR